jgi:hypothetical protein
MSFWLQLLHGAWIQKQLACSTKMEWHSVATNQQQDLQQTSMMLQACNFENL